MGPGNTAIVVVLTVIGLVALKAVVLLIITGGDLQRLALSVRAWWRIMRQPAFAAKVRPLLDAEAKPAGPPKPSPEPLRLLTLLQRGDGRFLDFVMENVQQADDEQVVAAVRSMQPVWQSTLKEHIILEPVRTEPEGETIDVPPGFDPSAVQLTGNVTGQPPFRGALKHPGWRVREIKLPPLPEGQDPFVIQPAEVELP
jgi:hypothetical protein